MPVTLAGSPLGSPSTSPVLHLPGTPVLVIHALAPHQVTSDGDWELEDVVVPWFWGFDWLAPNTVTQKYVLFKLAETDESVE